MGRSNNVLRLLWEWVTHDFFKAFLAFFSLSLVGSVLNMLCRILLGRMLTSEQYGEMETMMQIAAYAAAPISAVQVILSREVAHAAGKGDEGRAGDLVWMATMRMAAYSAIAIAILAGVTPWIRDFFKFNSVWPVYATGAIVSSGFVLCIAQSGLLGKLRFKRLGVAGIVGPAFRILFSWLLIKPGFGASGALAALAGSNLLMGFTGLTFIRDLFARRAKSAVSMKPLSGHLLPTILIMWAVSFIGGFDIFIIKRLYVTHVAGDYARVSALARLSLMLSGTIAAILFPWVSTEQAGGRRTTHLLTKALAAGAGVGVACALAFTFFASFFLRLFYPVESLTPDMVAWTPWLAWALIPNGMIGFLVQYYMARREYRILFSLLPLGMVYGGWMLLFRHSIPLLILALGLGSMVLVLVLAWPSFTGGWSGLRLRRDRMETP